MSNRHIWVKGSSKDQRDPAAKRVEHRPAQASYGLSEPLQGWDEQAQPETGIKGADDSYLLLLNAFPPKSPAKAEKQECTGACTCICSHN